jgi:hypothetical protein
VILLTNWFWKPPLMRLPRSIRAGVAQMAKEDGISINQFVSIAVAEKLAMIQAETFFANRRVRADLAAFDELMQRPGGEPPRPGDEVTIPS